MEPYLGKQKSTSKQKISATISFIAAANATERAAFFWQNDMMAHHDIILGFRFCSSTGKQIGELKQTRPLLWDSLHFSKDEDIHHIIAPANIKEQASQAGWMAEGSP